MPVDLTWLPQVKSLPDPEAPPFVQPAHTKPGASIGELSLGGGIIAPLRRDGKGDFVHGYAEALIRASVERILGVVCMSDVSWGELEWMPEFGSVINRLRHRNADDGTADLGRYHVIDSLRLWEPRINVRDALVEFVEQNNPGSPRGIAMEIQVLYDIVGRRRSTGVLIADVLQSVTFQQVAA